MPSLDMGAVRHREEASPSYSWYVRDWRASHRVRELSWKERGFYRECLDWAWDLDGLPTDLEALRVRLHATKGDFRKLWPAAKRFFDVAEDGRLRNARQEVERRKQQVNRRRASEGGHAKGEGSRRASSTASSSAISTASSTASHDAPLVPSPSPSPSPLPLQEREKEPASLSPPAVDPFVDDAITMRAGNFVRRYEELYPKHRHGARYSGSLHRDYAAAVRLCSTWPDDTRLDKLAVIFLTTDHKFAEEGSRTIPQFGALASWCDGKLAEHEAKRSTN